MLAQAPPGPLHGVPVTVKDMFALPWRGAGMGTEHELTPAGESGAYRRLRDAGAVVVGLAQMHYLGLGTTGRVSIWGPVGNPWDPARCGGGSSGGSAAAVGARLVGGSIGSDSGGSTRLPAAYCGVTGLKTTFGAAPREGYTSRNMTFSAPGVFGRDAADARLLASVLLGRELAEGDARRAAGGPRARPLLGGLRPRGRGALPGGARRRGLGDGRAGAAVDVRGGRGDAGAPVRRVARHAPARVDRGRRAAHPGDAEAVAALPGRRPGARRPGARRHPPRLRRGVRALRRHRLAGLAGAGPAHREPDGRAALRHLPGRPAQPPPGLPGQPRPACPASRSRPASRTECPPASSCSHHGTRRHASSTPPSTSSAPRTARSSTRWRRSRPPSRDSRAPATAAALGVRPGGGMVVGWRARARPWPGRRRSR